MAARSNADCNISYYDVGIEDYLNEADNIKVPLMLHTAEEDYLVPKSAQQQINDKLNNNSIVTIHTYPNVDHAFACVSGKNYHEEYTMQANQRSKCFLERYLY